MQSFVLLMIIGKVHFVFGLSSVGRKQILEDLTRRLMTDSLVGFEGQSSQIVD